jgi:DNA-binding winged helix-turn-helix (wHTH) protein
MSKEADDMDAYETAALYSFDDFEVELATFEVRRNGRTLSVQPLIFDLLVHLLRNRDRMVSYAELNHHVWQDNLVSAAAARQAVSVLRKTLGDDGRSQRYVKNVSKRGYRFVGDVVATSATAIPAHFASAAAAVNGAMLSRSVAAVPQ